MPTVPNARNDDGHVPDAELRRAIGLDGPALIRTGLAALVMLESITAERDQLWGRWREQWPNTCKGDRAATTAPVLDDLNDLLAEIEGVISDTHPGLVDRARVAELRARYVDADGQTEVERLTAEVVRLLGLLGGIGVLAGLVEQPAHLDRDLDDPVHELLRAEVLRLRRETNGHAAADSPA